MFDNYKGPRLHVKLNKQKTQYWHIASGCNKIQVGEEVIVAKDSITILGHTFRTDLSSAAPIAKQQSELMKAELNTLAALPLKAEHKQMAAMGILTPRWHYSSWHYMFDWRQESKVRAGLVKAFFPEIATGPRSAPMAMLLFTRMHRCDPFAAKFWSLWRMLLKHDIDVIDAIQVAYDEQLIPLTPMATFADMVRQMGGRIVGALYLDAVNPPLPLTQPYHEQDYDRWSHEWRVRLRLGYMRRLTDHRREFRPLLHLNVDYAKTLAWYRALEPGKTKATLRVIMTGGVLTGDRAARHKGQVGDCLLCGAPEDNEIHRYWQCPAVAEQRKKVQHLRPAHPTTEITGVYTQGDTATAMEVMEVQKFMVLVTVMFTQAYQDAAHLTSSTSSRPLEESKGVDLVGCPPTCSHLAPEEGVVLVGGEGATSSGTLEGSTEGTRERKDTRARPKPSQRQLTTAALHAQGTLPRHIEVCQKRVAMSHSLSYVYRCTGCGAVVLMANRGRFIRNHMKCAGGQKGVSCAKRKRLTKQERLSLGETLGVNLQGARKKARRRLAENMVTLSAC